MKKEVCSKAKDPAKCLMKADQAISKFKKEIIRLEGLQKTGKRDIISALVGGVHPAAYPRS